MSDVLQSMGMTDAFDPALADFSALATYAGNPVFINRVLHKSFISVGEQGTRAGAATVAEIAAGEAMEPEEVKEVILNRPFLYLIWDRETHMPIFMGTFMDAQVEGTSVPAETDEIFYSPAEDPCMMEG
jgi:serpin B